MFARVTRCLAGYEDLNDAERILNDPTFRLIGSEDSGSRGGGAALPSRLHWFETEVLTQAANPDTAAGTHREGPEGTCKH
ncbi:hypothetical protein SBA5_120075 [Candidatus Sulfotelmatomonas gaucii]|uniref:Transposase DDE domain-containing protein n=1 Tax=Candidatus Sulfuritelmatomonas gaucii TaxID=2043161 RepID=A0A2N9L441_9BACT|nr:hypothetical protein SBA5_120075 [Candidatus Sulfotelmatomonas gaucii]